MSLLNFYNDITICDVLHLNHRCSSYLVAPRPYHALAFRTKGTASFSKDKKNNIVAPEESITYMPANLQYYADYPSENEIFVIHFYTSNNSEIEVFNFFSPQTLHNIFKKIHFVWNDHGISYYYRSMSLFYEILANISAQTDTLYKSKLNRSFNDAVEFIKNNYTDSSLSVEEVCRIANMSNTYFRKLFYERYGENPSEYIINLRLQHAEKLLLSKELSINQIALECGFNDYKYFGRVMKKKYGYPPSQLFIHK